MKKGYNQRIVSAFFADHSIPQPTYEFVFAPPRKWRFDLAWPEHKLALEVQGGLFVGGGHNRGAYMVQEHEKRNRAALNGWRILYVQPKELCMSTTALMLKEEFGML